MKRSTAFLVILSLIQIFSSCTEGGRERSLSRTTDTVTVFRDSLVIRDSIVLRELPTPDREASFILVDKETLTLTLYDRKGGIIMQVPCCCGKGFGDKRSRYDGRTPEGVFHVSAVQDSRLWTHDSHDGRGPRLGCYGNHFIRLHYPPYHKIGIHGTDEPQSMGKRESEGCIRLRNENIERLVPYVHSGMTVIITPSFEDMKVNRGEV